MKAIRRLTVQTAIPASLSALEELATNLRWSWHIPTRQFFADISPAVWGKFGTDPIDLLASIEPSRLEELSRDEDFVNRANALRDDLRVYLQQPRWYQSLADDAPAAIGYFSPEFGIASTLPQYSGGLGILAGDHLKSASDLGVPIIGVGLFYRSGYFAQSISSEGWQEESYPILDPDSLPLNVLRHPDGTAARIALALPGNRALYARVWQVAVGRISLLLLDTDIPDNEESLRSVTDRLYGGGGEHRLLQEILLGIGGVRAIKLYCELTGTVLPEVYHSNEGHAGFLGLERISDLIGEGLSFGEALQVVRAGTVFTTHTPVPAGIDRFDAALVELYFSTDLLRGVSSDEVLELGSENYDGGSGDTFNMAVMGLRLGQRANGVSKLHGEVSRDMFGALWPGFDSAEVPITSVTNGVHAPTWTDPIVVALAVRTLGQADTTACDWSSDAVSDADLWKMRNELRAQLVDDARRRVTNAWRQRYPRLRPPAWYQDLLDPNVLTIGFARRVPTYKRLTLMLQDPDRLRSILLSAEHPVQIVIAGKSHPADDGGKRLIQQLIEFTSTPELRTRMVFLPNYDIAMARLLYPGTDVWLNNPLRPLEACGTSGMKAALNGSLNLSILDGWWAEFYDEENGWAIPSADAAGDADERDELEANALYDLIEHQVAPRFYDDRSEDGVPHRWVESIRHTLSTLSPKLSADRMVREYVERLYIPATESRRQLVANSFAAAHSFAAWKDHVTSNWSQVAVEHVESGGVDAVPEVGDELHVRVPVHLGALSPSDVCVQVVYGRTQDTDVLLDTQSIDLDAEDAPQGDTVEFTGTLPLTRAGSFGYNVRVVPRHPMLASAAEMGLVAFGH